MNENLNDGDGQHETPVRTITAPVQHRSLLQVESTAAIRQERLDLTRALIVKAQEKEQVMAV